MSLDASQRLLRDITRCPKVDLVRNGDTDHPCARIVSVQRSVPRDAVQLPEPWSGRLHEAPLLFISSNPSLSKNERYPVASWADDRVERFFEGRFEGGEDGAEDNHTRATDGTLAKQSVSFWSATQSRAAELMGHPVKPGIDYALTEVVHCKSESEVGVKQAVNFCTSRYFHRVVGLSPAVVLVVYGAKAKAAIATSLLTGVAQQPITPTTIGGIDRLVVFLPHPSSFGPKTALNILGPDGLARVQEHLSTPN
jgi:hypothetical protein